MEMATLLSCTVIILLVTLSPPAFTHLLANTETDDDTRFCYTCSDDVTCSCCCDALQPPDSHHDVICGCSCDVVTHRLSCDVAARHCDVIHDTSPLSSCANVTELIHTYIYCSYCRQVQSKHQQLIHASLKDISSKDTRMERALDVTIKISLVLKEAIDLDACLKYTEGKEGDLIQGFLNNLLSLFRKHRGGNSQKQGQETGPNITLAYTTFSNDMNSCGNDLYCLDLRFPLGIQFHSSLISDTLMTEFLTSHAKGLAYNFKNRISEDLKYFGIDVDSTDCTLMLT